MARIRTIKPEFFTSESVCSVSPLARLLFVGLWCEADREGRLKWKPGTIKIRYLPTDDVEIDDLADELIESGMIRIYTIDDNDYCDIPSFGVHQVINNREKNSEIPEFFDACPTRESGVKAEGRKEGKERKGKEGADRSICPYEKIIEIYHQKLPELPKVIPSAFNNSERKRNMLARWNQDKEHQKLEFWEWYFSQIRNNKWYLGENPSGWRADLGFLLKKSKFDKIIEASLSFSA